MNSLPRKVPLKISPFIVFFVAVIIGLIAVFVIDPLDPSTVSTPFLLGIVLMGLSLRQSTGLVMAVSLLYCFLTVYALIQFHEYYAAKIHVDIHPFFWLFQRTGLFLVLCGLAIYLAHYRTDTERILSRLQTILGKLPSPVVLSDASGNIVYANDAVTPVLHQTAAEITGKSYFEFFLSDATKGQSIRSYFDLFESNLNGIHELNVGSLGHATKMTAQLICLGAGPNRVMITVLPKAGMMPDQPCLS